MPKKPHPDHAARAFASVKQASAHADKLRKADPLRYSPRSLAVLRHPKQRSKYAVGLMAGGWLLYGYAP